MNAENESTPEQIAADFKAYLESGATSINEAARQIGYSDTALNQFIAGTYPTPEKLGLAIEVWLVRDRDAKAARGDQSYVSTTICENMKAVAMLADKRGMMAVIVAPSGVGKTHVLKALAAQTGGIYLSLTDGMTSRDFLAKLASEMGRRGASGTRGELHRWIVQRLSGSRRMIFIDESHRLGKAIGCIRSIFDEAQVTICMAGTLEIIGLLDDRSEGRGQFSSRCVVYNALDSLGNIGDPGGGKFAGRPLFSQAEVAEFLARRQIKLAPDALRLAWSLACLPGFGGLRLVQHAAGLASDLSRGAPEIDRAGLVNALKLLHGLNFGHMEELARRLQPANAAQFAVA